MEPVEYTLRPPDGPDAQDLAGRLTQDLAERLKEVRARIAAAAERAGRPADAVTLVAVTKGVPAALAAEALALGTGDLGENRVQEALPKIAEVPQARWHLIGHLQRNKAWRAAEAFAMIHSMDSLRLAEELARRATQTGRPVAVLLQVKLAGSGGAHGFAPETVIAAAGRIAAWGAVEVRGLMTMAPPLSDPEAIRAIFRRLRVLGGELRAGLPGAAELSMGMSDDFEIAVEEGATLVRVGRAVFGGRAQAPAARYVGDAGDAGDAGEGASRERRGDQEV